MATGVHGQLLALVAKHVEEVLRATQGFVIAQHHPMGVGPVLEVHLRTKIATHNLVQ